MKKFSVLIAGRHATSISLEEEFYQELLTLATAKNMTVSALVTEIDETRTTTNLSSAIRLYILKSLKQSVKSD